MRPQALSLRKLQEADEALIAREEAADAAENVADDDDGSDVEEAPVAVAPAPPAPAAPRNGSSSAPRRRGRPSRAAAPPPVVPPPIDDDAPRSLFSWLEAADLVDGAKWVRLRRLTPLEALDEDGKSIPVAGIVGDKIHFPFEEDWIARNWGGASFMVEVWERTFKGDERKVDEMRIQIGGPPLAYSERGKRVALNPSDEAQDRRRRRRFDERDDEEEDDRRYSSRRGHERWDSPYPRPAPYVQSPIMAAAAQHQADAQVEMLRTLVDNVQSGRREQTTFMTDALNGLRAQHVEAAGPVKEVVATAQRLVQQTQDHFHAQMDTMRKAHDAEMQRERESKEQLLRAEREINRTEQDRRDKAAQAELERRDRLFKEDAERADVRWKAALDAKEQDVKRARDDVDRIQKDCDRTLEAERTRSKTEIDRMALEEDRRVKDVERLYKLQLDTTVARVAELAAKVTAFEAEAASLREKANPSFEKQAQAVADTVEHFKALGLIPEAKGDSFDDEAKRKGLDFLVNNATNLLGAVNTRLGGVAPAQPSGPPPAPPGYAEEEAAPASQRQIPARAQRRHPIRTAPPPAASAPSAPAPPSPSAAAAASAPPPPSPVTAQPTPAPVVKTNLGYEIPIGTLVSAAAQIEQYRQQGVAPEDLADLVAQNQSPADTAVMADVDVDVFARAAQEGGVQGLAGPAGKAYLVKLRARLQAHVAASQG